MSEEENAGAGTSTDIDTGSQEPEQQSAEPTNQQSSEKTAQSTDQESLKPRDSISERDLKIPEELKDKPWVKDIKSEEDLWKEVDGLKQLKGKRNYVPSDDATPDEIKKFVESVRPESPDAYEFGEGADENIKEQVAKMLHENGTPKFMGDRIIKAYQEMEKEITAKEFSEDGMKEILKESFGGDYEKTAGMVSSKILSEHLNDEDKKALDNMPNRHLGLVYRLANNMAKAYGAEEGSIPVNARNQTGGGGNIEERQEALRKQIQEMSKKPHRAEDKQKLVDEYRKTFQ